MCIHDACVCAYSDLSSPPQDGQLQKEDQLLQINEESVLHMEYDDIIAKLQTVSQAGQPIRLVIARAVSVESQSGEIPDLNDVRYCWGGGGMQYVRVRSTYTCVGTCTCGYMRTCNLVYILIIIINVCKIDAMKRRWFQLTYGTAL